MSLKEKYHVIAELPANSKIRKIGFINLSIVLVLCVIGVIVSNIFWDDYTELAYSFRYQRNITVGWPATLSGWSWWMGIAIIMMLPFMYFMQDWKNPALALTEEGLFINQQMIRNTLVPYKKIDVIKKVDKGYRMKFTEPMEIVKQQVFLFKPFVKYNITHDNFFIYKTHTAGDIDAFMEQLKTKAGLQ
jgi:hypothetical protein